jgi:uncharacterized protein YkwD
MNWVDFVLIIIVLLTVWSAWSRGFILEILGLINWVGSLVLAFIFYPYTASLLAKVFPSLELWKLPLGFIITAIIARILIGLITRQIALATSAYTNQSLLNKSLGIIPGFINGIILAAIISALLLALPLMDGINSAVRNSRIANQLSVKMETVDQKLSPALNKAIYQTLNDLTIHTKSDDFLKLPFKINHAVIDSSLEIKMIELVNKDRAEQGLAPLIRDAQLTKVAREHSRDMFVRGYFSHVTPDGKDPFDRMHAHDIHFITAGENIALAQTISIAQYGFMHSAGHRANILNPAFGHIGIGILDGGIFGLMISQEFKN